MRRTYWLLPAVALLALAASACSTRPKDVGDREELNDHVHHAIQVAMQTDPGMRRFFDQAAGYVVFPDVGAAAVGVGGAYGQGEVFQDGTLVGYATMTQASIGLSLGGQKYIELIFFESPEALRRFQEGQFTFAGQASAVALTSGAAANANYSDGVAVFTLGQEGLMVQASIGGQKFSYAGA